MSEEPETREHAAIGATPPADPQTEVAPVVDLAAAPAAPAAPAEPAAGAFEPVAAVPEPAPAAAPIVIPPPVAPPPVAPPPPGLSSSSDPAPAAASAVPADRPEVVIGAAFAGGFLFAQILKRLAK